MKANRGDWMIEEMADLLSVSRSGYYKFCARPLSQRKIENDELLRQIKVIHQRSRCTYESPRVLAELKKQGYSCGKPRELD